MLAGSAKSSNSETSGKSDPTLLIGRESFSVHYVLITTLVNKTIGKIQREKEKLMIVLLITKMTL